MWDHVGPTLEKIQENIAQASERGPVETRVIHEVLDLVRGMPGLNQMVIRLREAGMSWHAVKAAIEVEMKR
jgi:hypothetical protein